MPGHSFRFDLISLDEGLLAEFAYLTCGMFSHCLPEDVVADMIQGAGEVERRFICAAWSCDLIGMNSDLTAMYNEFEGYRLYVASGLNKFLMSALRFPYAVIVLASADDFHLAFQHFLLARACSLSNDASHGGQEIACLFFSAEEHLYCCFGFPQVQEGRQHRPRCPPSPACWTSRLPREPEPPTSFGYWVAH